MRIDGKNLLAEACWQTDGIKCNLIWYNEYRFYWVIQLDLFFASSFKMFKKEKKRKMCVDLFVLTWLQTAVEVEDNHEETAQTQGKNHPNDFGFPHPECSGRARFLPGFLRERGCFVAYFITDKSIALTRWPLLLVVPYILRHPVRGDEGRDSNKLAAPVRCESRSAEHFCVHRSGTESHTVSGVRAEATGLIVEDEWGSSRLAAVPPINPFFPEQNFFCVSKKWARVCTFLAIKFRSYLEGKASFQIIQPQ